MVAGGIDSSGDSLSSTEVLLETASAWRNSHSQEGIKLCGGSGEWHSSEEKISCLTLTAEGSWENTTTLIQESCHHRAMLSVAPRSTTR